MLPSCYLLNLLLSVLLFFYDIIVGRRRRRVLLSIYTLLVGYPCQKADNIADGWVVCHCFKREMAMYGIIEIIFIRNGFPSLLLFVIFVHRRQWGYLTRKSYTKNRQCLIPFMKKITRRTNNIILKHPKRVKSIPLRL